MGTMEGKAMAVVNDEEMEEERNVCTGHRARTIAEGYMMLHAGGDRSSAGIIVNVEISKEVV